MLILLLIIKGIGMAVSSLVTYYPLYQGLLHAWQPHISASLGTFSKAPD